MSINFSLFIVPFSFKHLRTLTQMRDALLPKLMKGEVRVKV
jgi:hypothetical protein